MVRLQVLLLCLFFAGCNGRQSSEAAKVHGYEMQDKCAATAKQWLKNEWGSSTGNGLELKDFTNHYNKTENKCYGVIRARVTVGQNWTEVTDLYDLQENTTIAELGMTHMHDFSTGTYKDTAEHCIVGNKTCESRDEFDALLKPYMSN
jgi:hypothetical protein